jgi:abortive infection bacteriophage resistance protein
MNRSKPAYQKPFLSYEAQVALLKDRGLSFENEEQALKILERISYYRLSSYWHPLLADKKNKKFKENASFGSAFEIYKFDRKLRRIVMAEIEKIEIALRSKIVHILSLSNGSFWLKKHGLFLKLDKYEYLMSDLKKIERYEYLVSNIKREIERSDESLILSFKEKYSNDIPPAFMIFELITFGTLSRLYERLKSSREKQEIADFFGLTHTAFESWLHSLVYVRNICAHHARLWNREMRVSPKNLKTPKKQWLNNKQVPNNRIYFILSMIVYLLNIVNPEHSFKQKLNDLFSKYPNISKFAMGFSDNWQEEPLWK